MMDGCAKDLHEDQEESTMPFKLGNVPWNKQKSEQNSNVPDRREYWKNRRHQKAEAVNAYQRQWYRRHWASELTRARNYKRLNSDDVKKSLRQSYHALKMRVIKVLGGKCKRCGITDWRVLQVDHVNGGGTREAKVLKLKARGFYQHVLKNAHSGKYQLLCANCNWIKRYENHE